MQIVSNIKNSSSSFGKKFKAAATNPNTIKAAKTAGAVVGGVCVVGVVYGCIAKVAVATYNAI